MKKANCQKVIFEQRSFPLILLMEADFSFISE